MENTNGKSKAKAKVLGIVAEYNPWHKGHKYQLEESMKLCGAEYSVAIMNGDFTQRGEPAVLDKWTRAKMALLGGFDLVVELPFYFGCNSAEFFAKGAVNLAMGTGTITHLGFGSESGQLDVIKNVAKFLSNEPPEFQTALADKLKSGVSFPRARMEVLGKFLARNEINLLALPNNILAIEYVKQLYKQNSTIEPVTVKRMGDGYNDKAYNKIASATAIRETLYQLARVDQSSNTKNAYMEKLAEMLPKESYDIIKENLDQLLFKDNEKMFDLLRFQLLSQNNLSLQGTLSPREKHSDQGMSNIFSAVEGIENAFVKNVRRCENLNQLISKTKSKRYTYAGLSRLATHMVMGFTKETPEPQYIRVLGFTERGRQVLKMIKNNIVEPYELVTNINKSSKDLSLDIKASDIYNIIAQRDLYQNSDFVKKPVTIFNR